MLTVTAEDGTTKEYKVAFTVEDPGTPEKPGDVQKPGQADDSSKDVQTGKDAVTPKTGDNTQLPFGYAAAVLGAGVLAATVAKRRKTKI